MNQLINVREAALDLVLGGRSGEVLNTAEYRGPQTEAEAIAAELKRAVNGFKAAAMDEMGAHVDYARLRQSETYARYRADLTPQLRALDLTTLTTRQAQLAFWINLYNALVIDAVIAFGVRSSVLAGITGLAFFRRAAYDVGGQRYSCDDIEHGILRDNRGSPFVPGAQFAVSDGRRRWVVSPPDARIHFALNCASRSCPPVGVYDAERVEQQLELATRSFVAASTVIDPARGAVSLSRIFQWYRVDFGGDQGVLDFVLRYLPDDDRRAWIVAQRDVDLVYRGYDWGLNI